jgi:hypothetical protein
MTQEQIERARTRDMMGVVEHGLKLSRETSSLETWIFIREVIELLAPDRIDEVYPKGGRK